MVEAGTPIWVLSRTLNNGHTEYLSAHRTESGALARRASFSPQERNAIDLAMYVVQE